MDPLQKMVQGEDRRSRCTDGWTVRVIGDGTDKSDYHVVRCEETPGFDGDEAHLFIRPSTKFKLNGFKVHRYRQGAREEKNQRHLWKTNVNSWKNQDDTGWV